MNNNLLFTIAERYFRILVFILIICSSLNAQGKKSSNMLVNLSFEKSSLRYVFKALSNETQYFFVYNNEQVDDNRSISINVIQEKLDFVLDKLLDGTNCIWYVKDKSIVIVPRSSVVSTKKSLVDSLIIISGKVVDENGRPIPGATVSVENSKLGTISNERGEFSLDGVPKKSKLNISSLGFTTLHFVIDSKWKWQSFVMKEDVNTLDVMVVSTYLPTSKRYSLGGISTINAEKIQNKPVTNPLLALQGEVPGIVVNQNSGLANGGITVQIRGQNSFRNGTDPLYVVDGVPYPSQMLPLINTANGKSGNALSSTTTTGNPLSYLNPNDIESISVLKDADATSIYGSRAAAGAILITTKRGTIGPSSLNVNFQLGSGKLSRFLGVLNSKEYLHMRHMAKTNDGYEIFPSDYDLNGTWDTSRSTNWQKEMLGGTANFSHFQTSISGGGENIQFLVGVGYHKETTVYRTNLGDQKGSVHFNIANSSHDKRFKVQLTGNYMQDVNRLPVSNRVSDYIYLPPVAPALYNSDGTLNWALNSDGTSTWVNPLATFNNKGQVKATNLISNLSVQYELFQGLTLKSSFGYTSMQLSEYQLFPLSATAPDVRKYATRRATYGNGNSNTWIVEPQLNYKLNLGKGIVEALIGASLQGKNDNKVNISGNNYSSDLLLKDPKSAGTLTVSSAINSQYKYGAFFGVINYRLNDRYIVHLSARRDGSSRFGSENLFHNFGSIGAGWIFSSEPWIQSRVPFLSFGKLSASYGTSGNDQIGDYQFINSFSSNPVPISYQGIIGLSPNGIPNPYLQWEETRKLQYGIDLGFIEDNNILLSINYYRNRSSNQLLAYKLPSITGASSYTRNLPATIQNSGLELTLNTTNIKTSNFRWTSYFNLTVARNKLVSFPGLASSTYASSFEIGKPMTGVKLYRYHGVDPQTGIYDFYDAEGKVVVQPGANDRTVMLDFTPTFYSGLGNSVSFKRLSINFLFQASKQVVNNIKAGLFPGYFGDNLGNQPTTILNGSWRYSGDIATIQKFSTDPIFTSINTSDFAYSNVWYIRLRNVSLSWKVPESWIKNAFKGMTLSLNCQNVLTITNFDGMDPETGSTGFPPLRVIMGGVNINL